jgi:(2Fe-2S) ferredoxin
MTYKLADANRSLEPIEILICQNRTCRKQGAANVLAAFRAIDLPHHISFEGCGCLGNCGNGPMVLVLPARIWYYRVHPQDVTKILTASIDRCESS